LYKIVTAESHRLSIAGLSPRLMRIFRLHGVAFLAPSAGSEADATEASLI
jgi:hypothetical protein